VPRIARLRPQHHGPFWIIQDLSPERSWYQPLDFVDRSVYDGANISAQLDHNPAVARDARDAAASLLNLAAGRRLVR
jgi:hypothetical protein